MPEIKTQNDRIAHEDGVVFENVDRIIDLRRSPNDMPCPTRVIDVIRTDKNGKKSVAELHLLADLIP